MASARPLLPVLATALLAVTALAGCSAASDEPGGATSTSGSRSGTGSASSSSTGAANRAPTAGLNATADNATGPLAVTFALSGSDPDGDALSWTLAFGDGNATNGTSLPASANHTYAAGGNYTAVLTVSDGRLNATANATIAVVAAALPDPLHYSGTLTAVPYVPQTGVTPNELIDEATATHAFTLEGQPAKMTIVLAFAEGNLFNDVDLYVTDPSGEETASEAAGPEPPLEFEAPAAGDWSIRVFAYGGEGEVDYTVDVTFA